MDCVFCKIRDGEIKKEFLYQDKNIMVFPDINPAREIHILTVVKKHIEDFLDLEDDEVLKSVRLAIQSLIKENKLENAGYRILVNGGGAQIVNHLHFHLIGPLGQNVKI